jgi:hypothetical protein
MTAKEILNYISENPEQTWGQLAEKLGFKHGEQLRAFYRAQRRKNPELVLKSRWQQQTKGGGTIWLESYRVQEVEFFNQFKEFQEDLLKDIKLPPSTKHKTSSDSFLLEIGIPDFHLGKYNAVETLSDQKQKFIDSCLGLYKKITDKYPVDLVLFPIGNDYINSDTILYTTTKGTPQHDNSSWKESFRAAWSAVITVIDEISKKHNIHVPIVQGNHDYQKCFYLGEVLTNRYINSGVVSIDNSMEHRKYFRYYKNLFGYTHGNTEKHLDLPIIMATENSKDFGECPHRYFRLGHLHKHLHNEHHGVGITVLPSLSKPDEWLKAMGYNNTIRRCQGYLFHKENGLDTYTQQQ